MAACCVRCSCYHSRGSAVVRCRAGDAGLPGPSGELRPHRRTAIALIYDIAWNVLPNLAGEAIVPLLAKVMPLPAATQLFLTTTVFLWALGPAADPARAVRAGECRRTAWRVLHLQREFHVGILQLQLRDRLELLRVRRLDRDGHATDGGPSYRFRRCFHGSLFLPSVRAGRAAAGDQPDSNCRDCSRPAADAWHGRRPDCAARSAMPGIRSFSLKPAAVGAGLAFDLFDTMQDRFEAAILYGFDQPALALTIVLHRAVRHWAGDPADGGSSAHAHRAGAVHARRVVRAGMGAGRLGRASAPARRARRARFRAARMERSAAAGSQPAEPLALALIERRRGRAGAKLAHLRRAICGIPDRTPLTSRRADDC